MRPHYHFNPDWIESRFDRVRTTLSRTTETDYTITYHGNQLHYHVPRKPTTLSRTTETYYTITYHGNLLHYHLPRKPTTLSRTTETYYTITYHGNRLHYHIPREPTECRKCTYVVIGSRGCIRKHALIEIENKRPRAS